MDTFMRFLYEFLSQCFSGFVSIFNGLIDGIVKMFDINSYIKIVSYYKDYFNKGEWFMVVIAVAILVVLLGLIVFLIVFLVRKYIRFRKTVVKEESMLEEIADLNSQVANLVQEKEDILAMKVSHLGLKPGETDQEEATSTEGSVDQNTDIRFAKLNDIDIEYANYKVQNYNNTFTLPDLVNNFRNFAASQLKLYYKEDMIRLYVSSLATTKLVILQGISGTGKTSLAYAWGKFLKHDSCVASVQPSWRDRSELFGYFNEIGRAH